MTALPPHERLTLAQYRETLLRERAEHPHHQPPKRHEVRLSVVLRARLRLWGVERVEGSAHDWERLAAEVEGDLAGRLVHVEAHAAEARASERVSPYDDEAIREVLWQMWRECEQDGLAPAHKPIVVVHPPVSDRPTWLYVIDMPTRRLP
jgi:hypothetical protein